MLKWLHRFIWLLPTRAASVSVMVILLAAVVFPMWLSQQQQFAFGLISGMEVPSGGQQLIELQAWPVQWPGIQASEPHELLLVDEQQAVTSGLAEGSWLLAQGDQRLTQYRILKVDRLTVFPLTTATASLGVNLGRLPDSQPLLALVLGSLLIVAGRLLMRFLIAITLAGVMAALVWHAAWVADYLGVLKVPQAALYPLVLIGLAFGAAAAFRTHHDLLKGSLERVLAVLLLMLWLPDIAARFDWPRELSTIVMLLLTLLTPLAVYVLIGAYCLALGLAASTQAAYVILVLSIPVAIVLQAALTPASSSRTDRIMMRLKDQQHRDTGQIPMRSLMT